MNNLVVMQMCKNLNELLCDITAPEILEKTTVQGSLILKVTSIIILLNNVIVRWSFKNLIHMGNVDISTLHDANISYDLIKHILGKGPCLGSRDGSD